MKQRSRRQFLHSVGAIAVAVPLLEIGAVGRAGAAPAAEQPAGLAADDRRLLMRLGRRLIPVPSIGDSPYAAIVQALGAAAAGVTASRGLLAKGLEAARAKLGADAERQPDAVIDAYLQSVAQSEFFRLVLSVAVPTFANDHEVWKAVGYEGESLSRGGYLRNGFNDLAWLPEPAADSMGPLP